MKKKVCLLLLLSFLVPFTIFAKGEQEAAAAKAATPVEERVFTERQAFVWPYAEKGTNTFKQRLMAKEWIAMTGQPLTSAAGVKIFLKGGNAVDAACAMLAAVGVLHEGMSFGGEAQALIYSPDTGKVYGLNGCGVAPTGMTTDYFLNKGMAFPPDTGVDGMLTPGSPGGLLLMLGEFGSMSLKDVLEPAIDLADGYPMTVENARTYGNATNLEIHPQWKYSGVYLPNGKPPKAGEIFSQADLAATFRKMVQAEQDALQAGKTRQEAIRAAYDRFYTGDIAEEMVRGMREQGSTVTMEDLANWKPLIEEPVAVNYRGIDVYKLNTWTQGPTLLQTLNILENFDLKSMGFNSTQYIHTIFQAMNLAYADRDFYYGDPYVPPEEPIQGLLSKEYARDRAKLINPARNDPEIGPGDPYPYQGGENPFKQYLSGWNRNMFELTRHLPKSMESFHMGTTSIQAADRNGWVVSITPSGGWTPTVVGGRTGVGWDQRAQSFVCDPAMNPYNVVEPGKRPRVTLTPSMALKDGQPFMSWSHPGGDVQEQGQVLAFLAVAEFGMDAQEAAECPKFVSYQMNSSFGAHEKFPGRITLDTRIPLKVGEELKAMGYEVIWSKAGPDGYESRPLTITTFDHANKTMMGGTGIPNSRWGLAW
jgi:gamma-glutamyltranspeptidase/glutathione hydrolase